MIVADLDPVADRPALAALLDEAGDYFRLWHGRAPLAADVDEALAACPPGCDPAASRRLGLWCGEDARGAAGGRLDGFAELSFGFPEPDDAYLGFMILAPRARSMGRGAHFLAHVEALARPAPRLLLAVLEANPRGRAFWEREGFRPTGVSRHDAETGHVIHRLAKAL